jgi:Glycosyl transferase family 2
MWANRQRWRSLRLIKKSALFDENWYRSQFAGEKPAGDLLQHYFDHGMSLGYSPSPKFDSAYYVATYPDVAASGIHPLVHYILWGRKEGRDPEKPLRDIVAELRDELTHNIIELRDELTHNIMELRDELTDTIARVDRETSGRLVRLESNLDLTINRLDYVLAESEGLAALREELAAARNTDEFQLAYEEANPLVTVCVITAERPTLLVERCLRSIQAQTYDNLQILVYGDHCVDDTEERVAKLKDSRIEFRNLSVRGPYPRPGLDRWRVAGTYPVNAAVEMAKGRFITHLDDDDRFENNRIEELVSEAKKSRAEFLWHPFWFLQQDGNWKVAGNGSFELGQVQNSSVFYHRFFSKLPYDVFAYRVHEPGDWNFFRKIKHLRPKLHFVEKPMTWYYTNYDKHAFVGQRGETFLD